MATPFQDFWPCQTAPYPTFSMSLIGNLASGCLQLLQTYDIGLCLLKKAKEDRQPAIDALTLYVATSRTRLAVAVVSFAGLFRILRLVSGVGGKRAPDLEGLVELALLVTTHVALVGSCIDELAF
jgi:hypothetical protein